MENWREMEGFDLDWYIHRLLGWKDDQGERVLGSVTSWIGVVNPEGIRADIVVSNHDGKVKRLGALLSTFHLDLGAAFALPIEEGAEFELRRFGETCMARVSIPILSSKTFADPPYAKHQEAEWAVCYAWLMYKERAHA